MDNLNLGKCCICERAGETVRNAMTLDVKIPDAEKNGGWGCFVCGQEPFGAVAVLCDECLEQFQADETKLKFACLGYPGENRRIEIEKLTEPFGHDLSKHPKETEMNFIQTDAADFNMCQNCLKVNAVVDGKCATCGEEICLLCGCTESQARDGGCEWVRPNVCSNCDPFALGIF